MSKPLINQHYQNVDILLNEYSHKYNYEVITELTTLGTKGTKVRPDGIVKNNWGLDIGLWESKDEKDDIEAEIDSKIKKGYPLTNILFEDSNIAVLFQRGAEVNRVPMRNPDKLHALLTEFLEFKSETVYKFEEAIEKFKADIPAIVDTLRNRIDVAQEKNKDFVQVLNLFFELCKAEINPDITLADIREMMIQHILTGDIFNRIFDDPDFHRHNTIAAELEKLVNVLFNYDERRNLLNAIEHYYEAINATAAGITDHHEKQKFLKVLYENFYKVYNPKAADRLGVVYTPNEIVQFMVRSTDYLLHKHFGKTLADKNVEILDPATGTGTFICEIIENAIPKHQLDYKYKNEMHANEVAILPYYIANLNIEYTFKQKMGYYAEFPNSCFVDTLDNTDALAYTGKQHSLFALSSENSERIKRQNSKKISVIIGNPPYNAKQALYNDLNSNRQYKYVDKRIKETYIKHGTAQNQIVVYDMYTRFYRWASDRVDKDGVICLITNNSYINGRAFDGFRKSIQDEFDFAYIIDLGGNIRELSGKDGIWLNEEHTIFGVAAAVGISIMFLVKKSNANKLPCQVNYIHPCDIRATRIEKFEWIKANSFENIYFQTVTPDKKSNWINQSDNDFEDLVPLIDKDAKAGKTEKALFKLFSRGIETGRDEWVYDFDKNLLLKKMNYFSSLYNKSVNEKKQDYSIKWTSSLEASYKSSIKSDFNSNYIKHSLFRPFIKLFYYSDKIFSHRLTQNHFDFFGSVLDKSNIILSINSIGNTKSFFCLITDNLSDLHLTGDSQCISLFCYDKDNNRSDNITDWGLEQFQKHYSNKKITKEDIFHYTYGVLHNPAYRKKYELNLKREFPRLPFYTDFYQWAAWGKALMELHINYESVRPFGLKVNTKGEILTEFKTLSGLEHGTTPKVKVKLKANKENGIIEIDEITSLSGVPMQAWNYKLGNRSALEWVLDQYKEKKPSDPTIAEKFNTYRFADYKEYVIDLLQRVCTVSVETMKIIGEMENISNK